MTAERTRHFHTAGWIFSAAILIAFLLGVFFKNPARRKYPEREPVVFWHMWSGVWKTIVEDICVSFNESQNQYEVLPLSVPGDVADSKFLLSVAGGAPPDCMVQWNQIVPQFAHNKVIAPLDPVMSPEDYIYFKETTFPVAQKIATVNGRPYCMPLALDIRACYFRLDHLHEVGLLPPGAPKRITDKEEFEEIAALLPDNLEELAEWGNRLHVFDNKGRIARLGFLPEWLRMFAPAFGGGFYDWEAEKLTLNTPENRRALRFIADETTKLGFDNVVRFKSSLTGKHGADWPFALGKRSITIDGQWRVQQLKQLAPDIAYTTAPLPPPKKGGKKNAGWVHGNFMIIPTGAKNPQGAWEFIKFWIGQDDPERAARFYTRAGWLPPRPQIANTECFREYVKENPQFQTFIDLLDSPNIEPTPPVTFQLLLYDLIKRADESATRGTLTPKQALDNLEEQINDEIARKEGAPHEK